MNGRDRKGKFAAGNRYGKGRPVQSNKQDYLGVTESVVTPERWRRIIERAANDAETGTGREAASAREFLGKYILPLPQKIELTNNEVPFNPIQIYIPSNSRERKNEVSKSEKLSH